MSTILQLVQQHRKAILDREKAAMADLQRSYEALWPRIGSELSRITQQMEQRLQNGEKIPQSWLYEQRRLQSVLSVVESTLKVFVSNTLNLTWQQQMAAARTGAIDAQALLSATVPIGYSWHFGQIPADHLFSTLGLFQPESPLAKSLQGIVPDAVKAVKTDFLLGLSTGKSPLDIARDVRDTLHIPYSQATVIVRSNALNAYRYAAQAQYQANDDIVTSYVRSCAKDARTCVACLAMDGTEYDTDEFMELHACDRCVMIPKTKAWQDIFAAHGLDTADIPDAHPNLGQTGEEWFSNQSAAMQKRILGPGKYDLWQSGKVDFKDFASTGHSQWGPTLQVATLQKLKRGA